MKSSNRHNTERAIFATRIGAIAAAVGSAVGLGNIWKFPYEAGANGGGAFVLIYIVCVFLLGIPVIISEFVIGRATHKNAVGALRELSPIKYLHYFPYLGIIASVMIISFYSVVCGWIVEYLILAIKGGISNHSQAEYSAIFTAYSSNPYRSVLWTWLFLIINAIVLLGGIKKGIERSVTLFMPILFVLLIVFCINSMLLPSARSGLDFLFNPDFNAITPRTVIMAMGQAFFSLSLGLSCLLTYASYFKPEEPIVRTATTVAVLDTVVALLSGIIIFPAVFNYGLEPTAGPKLVFEVLPSVFQQMSGGYVWAVLFFVLLLLASLTSTISMSEISVTFFQDEWRMKRKSAVLLNTMLAMIFGALCALSFGVMSNFKIFGMTIFDLFDYVSSNLLLPFGGIFFSVFVGWLMNRTIVEKELPNGGSLKVRFLKPIVFCIRWVAPIAITIIFIYGLNLF